MPYGNFSRDQALIEERGKYLVIGGPIDPDVKHVTEICAWIIQGLFDGNDAAATEMADIAGDAESRLLLFKNVATATATTTGATPVDGGSLESEWRLDDTGPKLRLIKTVVLENGQRGAVPLELVTPEADRT